MSLDQEQLAFAVRPELGEIDYQEVYAEPLPVTMDILKRATDALYMYQHLLPQAL